MKDIINALQTIAPLAHWTTWPDRDPACPPIVWFTFQRSSEKVTEFLQRAVNTFTGTIRWEVQVRGGRWILMPAWIKEYAKLHRLNGDLIAAAELMEKNPEFGERANAELADLVQHLLQQLKKVA